MRGCLSSFNAEGKVLSNRKESNVCSWHCGRHWPVDVRSAGTVTDVYCADRRPGAVPSGPASGTPAGLPAITADVTRSRAGRASLVSRSRMSDAGSFRDNAYRYHWHDMEFGKPDVAEFSEAQETIIPKLSF